MIYAPSLTTSSGVTVGAGLTTTGTISTAALVVSGGINTGSLTTTGNITAVTISTSGDINVSHIAGNSGIPTSAFGAGAGAGPSANSVTGTDVGGTFIFTTGTTTTADATIITITFARPYSIAPRAIIITPVNKATATLAVGSHPFVSGLTTTGFNLTSSAAIGDALALGYYFIVIQ